MAIWKISPLIGPRGGLQPGGGGGVEVLVDVDVLGVGVVVLVVDDVLGVGVVVLVVDEVVGVGAVVLVVDDVVGVGVVVLVVDEVAVLVGVVVLVVAEVLVEVDVDVLVLVDVLVDVEVLVDVGVDVLVDVLVLGAVVDGAVPPPVVRMSMHQPVKLEPARLVSSTTHRFQVPFGSIPLKSLRLVELDGVGAGAGHESSGLCSRTSWSSSTGR